jgi:hypothetical protein
MLSPSRFLLVAGTVKSLVIKDLLSKSPTETITMKIGKAMGHVEQCWLAKLRRKACFHASIFAVANSLSGGVSGSKPIRPTCLHGCRLSLFDRPPCNGPAFPKGGILMVVDETDVPLSESDAQRLEELAVEKDDQCLRSPEGLRYATPRQCNCDRKSQNGQGRSKFRDR